LITSLDGVFCKNFYENISNEDLISSGYNVRTIVKVESFDWIDDFLRPNMDLIDRFYCITSREKRWDVFSINWLKQNVTDKKDFFLRNVSLDDLKLNYVISKLRTIEKIIYELKEKFEEVVVIILEKEDDLIDLLRNKRKDIARNIFVLDFPKELDTLKCFLKLRRFLNGLD